MKESDKKMLTEFIGECLIPCLKKCRKVHTKRQFTDPRDGQKVKDELRKDDGQWYNFLTWFGFGSITYDEGMVYVQRLLADWDNPERFCEFAVAFLKEEKNA